jgi:hypothetical protein
VFRSRLCKPSYSGVNFLYKLFLCHSEVGWNKYNSVNTKKASDVSVVNKMLYILHLARTHGRSCFQTIEPGIVIYILVHFYVALLLNPVLCIVIYMFLGNIGIDSIWSL